MIPIRIDSRPFGCDSKVASRAYSSTIGMVVASPEISSITDA